jgi:RNA polymerase sigma factor (sigma-70 family)
MRLASFQAHVLAQRTYAGPPTPLSGEAIGKILAQSRRGELRLARGFRECRGLSPEQLEDIYQDTVLALLQREHRGEEHLIGALRLGIKQRALKAHRDIRRRREILQEHAPGMERDAQARAGDAEPEHEAILGADRATVQAFLAQLTGLERAMFCACAVHGLGYRAAAQVFGVDVRAARRAARAVERKREGYAGGFGE